MTDKPDDKGGKLLMLDGARPDEEIIAILETALREAKEGKVFGGALLLQGAAGLLRQDLGGMFHSGDLMLQIERLKVELLDIEFGPDGDDDEDDPEGAPTEPQ